MNTCFLCQSAELNKLVTITSRPDVENNYNIPSGKYYREVHRCLNCGVFNNFHTLLQDDFYKGFYNNSITTDTLKKRFDKLVAIEESKSDNKSRVKRIVEYTHDYFPANENAAILDVGSGTCVFLHEMKKHGFNTTCIDPDANAVKHAIETVHVDAGYCGTIFDFRPQRKFNLITFNKVLEHVSKPVENVKEALKFLADDGLLYIELPEGDRILQQGLIDKRAEFVMEHLTVFNEKSIKKLAELSGCKINKWEVITDPSGKYTIYAFIQKRE